MKSHGLIAIGLILCVGIIEIHSQESTRKLNCMISLGAYNVTITTVVKDDDASRRILNEEELDKLSKLHDEAPEEIKAKRPIFLWTCTDPVSNQVLRGFTKPTTNGA